MGIPALHAVGFMSSAGNFLVFVTPYCSVPKRNFDQTSHTPAGISK
jgi:hypothetical protein